MTPDHELKRYRRLKRYIESLPPDERKLKPHALRKLKSEGLVDKHGKLTPEGELKMHQLELLEWMSKSPRYKQETEKEEKRRVTTQLTLDEMREAGRKIKGGYEDDT